MSWVASQSVVADLRTLTGGSKPPVARVHSDQAGEFLSPKVMEWLKEQGIKQTMTSAYDSQANGVAERWLNLIKTKATVLLASKCLHTSFWCYAVAWVAKAYNDKVLGQKPRRTLPAFGQLLLVRTKRDNKLQERGELGIMAGVYPEIPNGVIVLTVENNRIKEQYTAHVSPATFDNNVRWYVRRDPKDPSKMVYVNEIGEVSWDAPISQLHTVEEKQPQWRHPQFITLQRAVDGWAWFTSNVGKLLPNFEDIDVEGEEEPLPRVEGARYHSWQEIEGSLLNKQAREAKELRDLPPVLVEGEVPGVEMPPPPSGRPPRRIKGDMKLPAAVSEDLAAKERLQNETSPQEEEDVGQGAQEQSTATAAADPAPILGGGEGPNTVQEDDVADRGSSGSDEQEKGSPVEFWLRGLDDAGEVSPPGEVVEPASEAVAPDQEEAPEREVEQPIPFRASLTPGGDQGEEDGFSSDSYLLEEGDELHQWYAEPQPAAPSRELPPRSLRSRNVARQIKAKLYPVSWSLGVELRKCFPGLSIRDEKLLWDQEGYELSTLNQEETGGLVANYEKGDRHWNMLMDPLTVRMRPMVQAVKKSDKKTIIPAATLSLDADVESGGYTVLSQKLVQEMDREERRYQKVFMILVEGETPTTFSIEDMVTKGFDMSSRKSARELKARQTMVNQLNSQSTPWELVICASTLLEQEVPAYFQKEGAMEPLNKSMKKKFFRRRHAPQRISILTFRVGWWPSRRSWVHLTSWMSRRTFGR